MTFDSQRDSVWIRRNELVIDKANSQRHTLSALVDQLSEQFSVVMACNALSISHSAYYAARKQQRDIDPEQLALRAKVRHLFGQSRGAAGSRTLVAMLAHEGIAVGRYKVRRLMKAATLTS